jgi:hypothetical protein
MPPGDHLAWGREGREKMNEIKQSHHGHGASGHERVHHEHHPYWTRAHHHWGFWVALFLMLAAMIFYVVSNGLALRPRSRRQQPLSGAVGH